jgi:hypothetical protein
MTSPAPTLSTPEALAAALRQWFPGKAVLAVAETDSLENEQPKTLPLMLVYTVDDKPLSYNNGEPREIAETMAIEVWEKAERFAKKDGSASPIVRDYDHRRIRDVLVSELIDWQSPACGRFRYVGYGLNTLHGGATVGFLFKFEHRYFWKRVAKPMPPLPPVRVRVGQMARPCGDPHCADTAPCTNCLIPTWRP